jgi:hypothetical protein
VRLIACLITYFLSAVRCPLSATGFWKRLQAVRYPLQAFERGYRLWEEATSYPLQATGLKRIAESGQPKADSRKRTAESQQPIAESQKCTQKNVPLQQNSTYGNLKALFLYTATVFVGSIGTKP